MASEKGMTGLAYLPDAFFCCPERLFVERFFIRAPRAYDIMILMSFREQKKGGEKVWL